MQITKADFECALQGPNHGKEGRLRQSYVKPARGNAALTVFNMTVLSLAASIPAGCKRKAPVAAQVQGWDYRAGLNKRQSVSRDDTKTEHTACRR